MHPLKYIAELLGTFTLTLAVSLSLALDMPVPTPVIAALTLGLFVYTIGGISGAQINPAVTLGLWSVKKMSSKDTVMYLMAQFVGAVMATGLMSGLGIEKAEIFAENTWQIGLVEAIGAFFLVFGVSAVVNHKVHQAASGLTIGGSLFLGILLTAGISNGVLNPAVALGISSFSVAYVAGPVVGGVLAAWVYRAIMGANTDL